MRRDPVTRLPWPSRGATVRHGHPIYQDGEGDVFIGLRLSTAHAAARRFAELELGEVAELLRSGEMPPTTLRAAIERLGPAERARIMAL